MNKMRLYTAIGIALLFCGVAVHSSLGTRVQSSGNGFSLRSLLSVERGKLSAKKKAPNVRTPGLIRSAQQKIYNRAPGIYMWGKKKPLGICSSQGGMLDLDTLEKLMTADYDGDGHTALDDFVTGKPCPGDTVSREHPDEDNPGRRTRRAFGGLEPLRRFGTKRLLIRAFLDANAREGLYPMEDVLNRIERNNIVKPQIMSQWKRRYLGRGRR